MARREVGADERPAWAEGYSMMAKPPETGGFRVGSVHPFEALVIKHYRLDGLRVHRLAVFLLAHIVIDQALSLMVGAQRIEQAKKTTAVTKRQKTKIMLDVARLMFVKRLKQAEPMLSPEAYRTAKNINNARNAFLHRFTIPLYNGLDVTTEVGLQAALSDAVRVYLEYAVKWYGFGVRAVARV